MGKELPYRIAKLILVKIGGSITAAEDAELTFWREDHPRHEELYREMMRGERFENYLRQSMEHDFRPKYALLEQKIKKDRHRRKLRKISYAAAILPFVLLSFWFLNREKSCQKEVVVSQFIHHGSSKALLKLERGKTIYLENIVGEIQVDSNVVADRTSLQYVRRADNIPGEMHTLIIPRGGEFFIQLEDGTKVWLNSESELRYISVFDTTERNVVLKGEAYFEVAKDENRPFVVVVGEQRIQVLGTSFGVRAYENEGVVLTTLEEGQVSVSVGERHVVLRPGEQAEMIDGNLDVKRVNTSLYTAWRTGKYIFIDQSLGSIMTTLSRWYDVHVFYASPGLEQIRFTGELTRYGEIEELLRKFEILEKVKFDIKDKTVIISQY